MGKRSKSALERKDAVDPMLSFLKPAKHDEVEEAFDDDRVLLDEFTALEPIRQSEAADHLAALWQCFVDEFSNPAAFQREPRDKQDGYIAKFERVASRSQEVKHTARGHLHYSVALMLRFLLIARDGARQQSALDLSGRVAGLINNARDREVMQRRGQFVDALSNSLFDASPPPITDVIVDRPMNFHDEPQSVNSDCTHDDGSSHDRISRPPRSRTKYRRDGDRWVQHPQVHSERRVG